MDGACAFTIFVLSWELYRKRRAAHLFEKSYWAERKGRARVELEMRKVRILLPVPVLGSTGTKLLPVKWLI